MGASGPFAQLARFVDTGPNLEELVQRAVEARGEALHVDASGRVSLEGEAIGRLVRGGDRLKPGVALVDGDAWNGGQRARLERRLAARVRDVVAEAMGGFPAEALTAEGRAAPLRAIAWSFARGLGIVRRDAALHEQVRLLDPDSHRRLDELGVRAGARFLLIEGATTAAALERRAMLTSLFEDRPRPPGIPGAAVVTREVMGGRDAGGYGYEWLGPVAVRIDALEGILAALPNPRRLEQAFDQLGVEGALRAIVVKHAGRDPRRRRQEAR
jgi:ATP-dependent RNA helicase SUPV3L1/SUV3